MSGGPLIALVGNPNSGKSTLFNRLTGLRQHVANYPGVTVERRIGTARLPDGRVASVVDLPGVRSLAPRSPDERIAVDVLLGRRRAMAIPDVTVVVLNALHLDVGLYLLLQVRDLGVPVIAALNVADEAEAAGVKIDLAALERETGVRIVRTVATRGEGLDELRALMATPPAAAPAAALPGPIHDACTRLRAACTGPATDAELAAAMLEGEGAEGLPEPVRRLAVEEGAKLRAAGVDLLDALVVSTHRRVATATAAAQDRRGVDARGRWTRRLDAVLTHPVGGYAAFLGLMTFIFWMMFSISEHPMGWIESGFSALAGAAHRLPPGLLTDLLADGVIAGVGSVVVFLPQIVLLFLFLGILEDSGYMARAVLLLDRPLAAAGLSGRAFVPLLGSTACAVPGVMATRVIPDARERLAAILVAPLMTCSARLPVYACFIGLLIPDARTGALILAGLYVLGIVSALVIARILRSTTLRSARRDFMVELPPYRWPGLGTTGVQLWHRVKAFLLRAGTVIVGITILLWFLSSFPRVPGASASEQLEASVAGKVGRFVEPAIRPLGFDWKAGIGILTSFFSARETFIATMGTVYSVEAADGDDAPLRRRMKEDRHRKTGLPVWTMASGLAMLVFYVFAMLCSSTVVTVAKEAGGWKWALLQLGFMSALAYVAAWGTYRAAVSAGWGA